MTTSPKAIPLTETLPVPVIPLTPEARAAYQTLFDNSQAAIEATTDVGVLEALNASQLDVGNVLTKDDMYRLHASTALYHALLSQINDTNKGLIDLQKKIAAVPAAFAHAAEFLTIIKGVLKVVPIP